MERQPASKKLNPDRTEVITVRIPSSLKTDLQMAADRIGVTPSALVRIGVFSRARQILGIQIGTPSRQPRDQVLSTRLTEDETTLIKTAADKVGLPVSELARFASFERIKEIVQETGMEKIIADFRQQRKDQTKQMIDNLQRR